MTFIEKLTCVAILIAASACSNDPVRVEQDYGNSVRNMIEAQMADPAAARHPSSGLPGGLDGGKGEKAIEAYRNPPQTGGQPSSLGSATKNLQ